jgi:hypothetical protein
MPDSELFSIVHPYDSRTVLAVREECQGGRSIAPNSLNANRIVSAVRPESILFLHGRR